MDCGVNTVDQIVGSGGGCVEAGGILPRPPPPLQQAHQPCAEVLHPKRQAVVDRLRRRIESYRRRQTECIPRFDQSFNEVCEQQNLETTALQRRFFEGKSKRAVKKGGERQQQIRQQDNPQQQQQQQSLQLQNQLQGQIHPHGLTSNLHSSVHVQQKFLKRPAESGTGIGSGNVVNLGPSQGSPPGKIQRINANGPQENLTKFSVEIVQQLEFTSATDSQPQQISTNVTVKALTNTSVKSETGGPLLECKREPDNDFADLDQCAAALEKDNFPGFTDLIGEASGGEIIMSDTFKDLISEISDYRDFMKEFDFEEKGSDNINSDDRDSLINDSRIVKVEEGLQGVVKRSDSPNGLVNRGFGPRPGAGGGYGGELSPAAQTLKQMAEQHQHKQMGLGARGARSPYGELQDYLSGPGGNFRKQEQVKQEPTFPPSYKQYSPYGSPSPGSGSPGYLPRGPMGGPSPPRPPSGPPPVSNNSSLHINQVQHLHVSHPQHGIQVSGGQHMQLSGELGQGNVSIAAQQGMFFGQQAGGNSPHQPHPASGQGLGSNIDTCTVSQSQTINFTQQTLRQRQQQAQQQAASPMAPSGSPSNGNMGNVPTSVNGNVPGANMAGMGVNNPNMGMSMGGMAMAREHHAKLLQQQQQHMLRAQQQQQQMGGQLRPPPPDYKASQGPIGQTLAQQQARFAQNSIRRAINQPIPPSGPMMRGGMMYGGGRYIGPGVGPGQGVPTGQSLPDWRHQLLIQQQQSQFIRHPNMQGFPQQQNQGGFPVNNPNMQQQLHQQQQQQLLRNQQQQQMMAGQQLPHQIPPHILAQQNQSLSMQGQMQNIHMNQSQSISIHQNNGGGLNNANNGPGGGNSNGQHQQNGPVPVTNFSSLQNTSNNVSSSFPAQTADFNLDFLENMPSGDSSNFTAQELLNSLESDPGFNLQDIL